MVDNHVLEKKYKSLKRKYKALSEESHTLINDLSKAKKRIIRLQKEKGFLLDRLLKYDDSSSDSGSVSGSTSSGSDEPPRKRPREEFSGRQGGRASSNSGPPPSKRAKAKAVKESDKDDSFQICTGQGKDGPCKSKALANCLYCWHHAPLDPDSPFIFCQYRDPKRNAKKCNIPVAKAKEHPYCNYHVKLMVPEKLGSELDEAELGLDSAADVSIDHSGFGDDGSPNASEGLTIVE